MLHIICIERLLHIGSHFSLRKWQRRRPHFPTKLAAAASFSNKIGGSGAGKNQVEEHVHFRQPAG